MKYIEKPLKNKQDFYPAFWLAVEGHFNLANDSGQIVLFGWKDIDAWRAGADRSDIRGADFKLSEMQSFNAVWEEVATKLITSGTWAGGEIKDTEATTETTST